MMNQTIWATGCLRCQITIKEILILIFLVALAFFVVWLWNRWCNR